MKLRLEHALLESGVQSDVLLEIEDGWIKSVQVDQVGETGTHPGLTIPGFANCHSHAFHRALRAHTQRERGSFWTWREQMYAVAAELTPDTYFDARPGHLRRDAGHRDHRGR